MKKQNQEIQFETIESFLKRGGVIQKIAAKKRVQRKNKTHSSTEVPRAAARAA